MGTEAFKKTMDRTSRMAPRVDDDQFWWMRVPSSFLFSSMRRQMPTSLGRCKCFPACFLWVRRRVPRILGRCEYRLPRFFCGVHTHHFANLQKSSILSSKHSGNCARHVFLFLFYKFGVLDLKDVFALELPVVRRA